MENEMERFYRLRQRIFDVIREVDEGYHKSYEGAMDVTFSFKNIYEAKDIKDIESVTIELHCYLLVNGRHIRWEGRTLKEALDKVENYIDTLAGDEDV